MSEKQVLYRMNRLMRYTEIEAFSAQKNAGSKAAYFDQLTEFAQTAPNLTTELKTSCESGDLELFQKRVFELQKMFLAIGASGLLWEAEKIAEVARKGERQKCADRTVILCSKIHSLCDKVNDAKVDPDSTPAAGDGSSDTVIVAMAQGAGNPGLPKAPIEAERFARLASLIENFENDRALATLQGLMGSSYNNAVDSALASIHYALTHFDHDDANAQVKRLLALIREVGDAPGGAARKKILAIDDVPDVLNTVKAVLKEDYAVYCVTNHMAALKFLTNNSPDLILMDIEMPDLDGFELLGIIRRIKAYENTPALFLTGSVTVENIVKSRKAGGNDFLKKPIDAQVLLAKIKKHLG